MRWRSKEEIRAFLRQGVWFGGLAPAFQDAILERSVVKRFSAGRFFQQEDDDPLGLIAVLEGRVLLVRYAHGAAPSLVHVGNAGFWFGEMAVLTKQTLVGAQAQTDVTALLLPLAECNRLIAADPRFYQAFAQIALNRYRILMRYYVEARAVDSNDRVRLRLADLAELRRFDGIDDRTGLALELSQAQLAELVGLSRQKLNPRLRELQDEGFIRVEPRRVIVLDVEGLRRSVRGAA